VERYRAFARECMRWAERARNIDHREALLDMATNWAEAAARLDKQYALLHQFKASTSEAQRSLHSALENSPIDGAQWEGTDDCQPEQTDTGSQATRRRQQGGSDDTPAG
jgi:hypothetical protein